MNDDNLKHSYNNGRKPVYAVHVYLHLLFFP